MMAAHTTLCYVAAVIWFLCACRYCHLFVSPSAASTILLSGAISTLVLLVVKLGFDSQYLRKRRRLEEKTMANMNHQRLRTRSIGKTSTAKRESLLHFSSQINHCAQEGNLEGAYFWYKELIQAGLKPDTTIHTMLMHACTNAGQAHEAERWVEHMAPDAIAYTAIINAYAKGGSLKDANRWLVAMQEAGFEATTVTYTVMLHAFSNDPEVPMVEAKKWLLHMQESGVHLTVNMCNMIANHYAKAGRVDELARWIEQMRGLGVPPNVVSFNTLLKAASHKGRLSAIGPVLEEMNQLGLKGDVITYNTVLDICAKAAAPDKATSWFCKMEKAGVPADVCTYTSVILAYANTGEAAKALYWTRRARSAGITPDKITFTAVIKAFVTCDELQAAREMLDLMIERGPEPDVVTYTTMIDAYASNRRPDDALKCFRVMETQGALPTVVTFGSLMKGFSAAGDLQKVEDMHYEMLRSGIRGTQHTYFQLLLACKRCRNKEKAIFWFDDLRASQVKPNNKILTLLKEALGSCLFQMQVHKLKRT